jgi:hypothetical protein
MTPAEIVKKASEIGLQVVALTDHNSAANAAVFKYFCEKFNLYFIPAMETETKEEIHILCYFPGLSSLFEWQEIVYNHLPDQANDEDFFGPQIECDYTDQYSAKINRLLATAIDLNLADCLLKVKKLGGIVVPSHLDRSNSILSQLGFIPPEIKLSTVEISKNTTPTRMIGKYPWLKNYQFMQNSDSHYLQEIQSYQNLLIAETGFSFQEFKFCLEKINGRGIEIINT